MSRDDAQAMTNVVDIEKLKSEQGANITYLRYWSQDKTMVHNHPTLCKEIGRACDDIEAYREIVGLVLNGDDEERLRELLEAMTWTP